MLASIPSIMPVDKNKIHISSGFGWRQNPFTRSGSQFHPGIDLAGPIGTPIYATGDGVIIDPFGSMTGYGIAIVIDHGYGFETLYAHLSKRLVNTGDSVKRGQIIGYLGNTGPSTGPHLHYEVHRNGKKVNPINYIYSGFTNEEFQEMIKSAEESHEILS
jgi:murein DD-endopeptidase MepM/ murein hydrolase activator NlpD